MEFSDSHIFIEDIDPPLPGGKKYAAKLKALYVKDAKGRRRVDQTCGEGLPRETWGTTKEEARTEMDSAITKWISTQE